MSGQVHGNRHIVETMSRHGVLGLEDRERMKRFAFIGLVEEQEKPLASHSHQFGQSVVVVGWTEDNSAVISRVKMNLGRVLQMTECEARLYMYQRLNSGGRPIIDSTGMVVWYCSIVAAGIILLACHFACQIQQTPLLLCHTGLLPHPSVENEQQRSESSPARNKECGKARACPLQDSGTALVSFIRNIHVNHIKKTSPKVKADLQQYIDEYCDGATMLTLAKKANYPPFLFARYMVEGLTHIPKPDIGKAVANPSQMITDSSVLQPLYRRSEEVCMGGDNGQLLAPFTTRLAQELHQALTMDPLCGPRHDVARRMVGVEFEVVLEKQLSSIGIPFESEAHLRSRGTSRTPDVLLRTPVAIPFRPHNQDEEETWKIINWIDSKALFGDVNTHQQSVVPQAESYLHRFGPGLILYWFGHAPPALLNDLAGELVIAGWELPSRFMLPDGRVLVRDAACAQIR
eukprot:scaffold31831_cov168-Amphora_coffeaeformis.AAC.3